jgi:glycosyltransferase involved in cell wall biosynthesis
MHKRLTLAFITRNDHAEVDKIKKMIESVYHYVDEIQCTITVKNETDAADSVLEDMLLSFNNELDEPWVNITHFKWINDFAAARNFNLSMVNTEYTLWLDTDDVLEGAENIPKWIKYLDENKHLASIWFNYNYEFDKDGNCISIFPRERIFKTGLFNWIGKIHENAICKFSNRGKWIPDIKVIHDNTQDMLAEKAERNLQVSLEAYNEEVKNNKVDPRTIYDCARAFAAVCDFVNAEKMYIEFLNKTKSDFDYYDASIKLGDIYLRLNQIGKAIKIYFHAINTIYNWPDAYIGLSKICFLQEKYPEALHWINIAKMYTTYDAGGLVINPLKYTVDLWKLEAECLWFMNKAEESLKLLRKCVEICPSDERIKLRVKRNEDFLNMQAGERGAIILKEMIEQEGGIVADEKNKKLLSCLPDIVSSHPVFVRLRNKYYPEEGRRRIVIYCHASVEKWSPKSIESGIGGSEEAVINVAEQFAKLGYKVDVYNQCDVPGEYNGVNYHFYDQYDSGVPCEIFIAWRMWEYCYFAPADSFVCLWLHDKNDDVKFPENFKDKCHKIFVLSEYHRKDLEQFPDQAIYITRNGIDPAHFVMPIKRNPNKYIYASSPDRGLHKIIDYWDRIKEINPLAELHIFYGFTQVYDYIRKDIQGMEFKENLLEKIKTLKEKDVYYHGRVGHLELAKEFLTSSYWLYPCVYDEISCITAMKAQAAGCWPVCNDFAALKDTVKYGTVIHGYPDDDKFMERWLEGIKNALSVTDEQRQEMQEWALNNLSWKALAKDWIDKINNWKSLIKK